MEFEWDEKKRQGNLKKHGIDFADLRQMFLGVTLTILDDRYDYGEVRFVTLGLLNGIVIVVAHTEDDEVIRYISARKATRNEEKRYVEEIKDRLGSP
ncbi:MAG: BrnT family toxin [Acidobacteria bacterium]|nr:BrnT family toxin [Acidobacteriota bacterium]